MPAENESFGEPIMRIVAAASGFAAAFALGYWISWQRVPRVSVPSHPVPEAPSQSPSVAISAELRETTLTQMPQQRILAEALADFADEILELKKVSAQESAEVIDFASQKIAAILERIGAELIRSDEWNPEIQRAVEVRVALDGQKENEIVAAGASGLRIDGDLIRKQEVIIARHAS